MISKAVPEFGKEFSFEEYARHKTLVISRIFYVTMHGVTERIMVPLADMFNHYYEKVGQTRWSFSEKDNSFVVHAQNDIAQGDAICENYGEKPNYRFLFYYGFLIENNKKNAVYIKLYFNKEDTQVNTKRRMIGCMNKELIKTFKYFEYFSKNAKKNEKFLSYLRFVVYNGDLNTICCYLSPTVPDLKHCNQAKRKMLMPALTVELEKTMLMKLKEIVTRMYKRYPEDYESDVAELAKRGASMSFNEKNAYVFRMGEKKIFKDLLDMAEKGLKMLSMNAKEAMNMEIPTTLPYYDYLEKTIKKLI